jgi:hypothetical protein
MGVLRVWREMMWMNRRRLRIMHTDVGTFRLSRDVPMRHGGGVEGSGLRGGKKKHGNGVLIYI